MKFTRLRLTGFKSFVDPTELHIEPGLTGIVGPNGCGKSNLLEALRWVMGENRPTSMRGSGMDDVIFSGSATRPSRNNAEAILIIDNSDRSAPAPYTEPEMIEISRRIEREMGSVYRINGREVRQRDVHIFFADASTGPASPALVRQGQIGVLINQKPLARRTLLEEAAGISGLHQRRHEAELRLKAAETNLARLDDVMHEVEVQHQGLKRQARQASRYRNLSGLIRRAEAVIFLLRWREAEAQAERANSVSSVAGALVAERTETAARASAAQARAAAVLPPLREAEAAKAAALQRLIHGRDALASEETRARDEAQRTRQRIGQAEHDLKRERELEQDAKVALEEASREAHAIAEATERAVSEIGAAEKHAREMAQAAPSVPRVFAAPADVSVEAARKSVEDAGAAANAARGRETEALNAAVKAKQPFEVADREVQRLAAEAKALANLLRPEGQDLWPPLIDALRVAPGYEAALAAALGDELDAPLDEAAPRHWRNLGAAEPAKLPGGALPLSNFVEAPTALARRLAFVGVIAVEVGSAAQKQLKPGQRLVSQRGDLWRWDGFRSSSDARSPAALRLEQRNRLSSLEHELTEAKANRAKLSEEYSRARAAADDAGHKVRLAEQAMREREASLLALHDDATRAARTAEARTRASEAQARLDGLRREATERAKRFAVINDEIARWKQRREAAVQQISALQERVGQMQRELAALEAMPETLSEKRSKLFNAIEAAEATCKEASDRRAEAENILAEADRVAKAADSALAQAREERAGATARAEAAAVRLTELRKRMREELDVAPETLPELAHIKAGTELPSFEQAEMRVEKLRSEREQMGGVNLRAEDEAAELEQRLKTLQADRADLDGAIQRLRRGIQSLNREGRERLLASFEKVNANFERLFKELFQGGEARLTFTESDDPLEAGLEILAKPPGKRLQTLSLLSGGEQALTAIALIFAVFLVNPAPICVLDEVDAPLDDANVDRFCRMLDQMTGLSDTRFLVITHHALTMSRMSRLFGVTMAERGVSQLVSVSLAEAEQVIAAE
ncbi:MAG: chromosome segregation SMC family protein [Alphaproteobacteria bacterium]